jgi:SAM-dependent methyltransferase
LLDLGCSTGFVMEAGKRLGIDSHGMDVSSYAVEQCRARGLDAKVGTLDALPWDDGRFDLVVMKHVLEHTPEPLRALAEVRRVLARDGVVLIAVPNLRYWKGLWRRRQYRYFRPDDLGRQHYVYYDDATLRRVLAKAGFELLAAGKAVFRRRVARTGPAQAVAELIRYASSWLCQRLLRALLLRRELFVIAGRRE